MTCDHNECKRGVQSHCDECGLKRCLQHLWPKPDGWTGNLCSACWVAVNKVKKRPSISFKEMVKQEYAASQARFDPQHIRGSGIGLCGRKQVDSVLNPGSYTKIKANFARGGHDIQTLARVRLEAKFPDVVDELEIPMPIPGNEMHSDIVVFSSNPVVAFEVKSTSWKKIYGYQETGEGLPQTWNVDQVLLGWHCWRKAGYAIHPSTKEKIHIVPEVYKLLYVAREDFTTSGVENTEDLYLEFEVDFNQSRAEFLEQEWLARNDALAFGDPMLLKRHHRKQDWQCVGSRYEAACSRYWECWPEGPEPETFYLKRARKKNGLTEE